MRFTYRYNTKENELREGCVDASSRSDAYAILRRQGIKPFDVSLAPGFVNLVLSLGKRVFAIIVLSLLLVTVVMVSCVKIRTAESASGQMLQIEESRVRRQVIGDSAIIEKGIQTGWADVFSEEGERFLASFAIPGVVGGVRCAKEDEVLKALGRNVFVEKSDGIETRQVKSIVEGMKDELRAYLQAGGSIVGYGQRLVERQEAELLYYRRASNEIRECIRSGAAQDVWQDLWERRNAELRRIGVKLVRIPTSESDGDSIHD